MPVTLLSHAAGLSRALGATARAGTFALLATLAPGAVAQPHASTGQPSPAAATPAPARASAPAPFKQEIPVAAYSIEMLPIPADASRSIRPFWMSATEISWEAFDVFAYRLDETDSSPVDAESRPTKPYLPPDRGFGHEGYAAISITHKSATKFCEWLSAKSGKHFRLASEDEWEHACRAGAPADAATPFPSDAPLTDFAWFAANADGTPHPIARKKPNAWGLFDMLGNVREWVNGRNGKPTTKGGCYLDPADKLTITARADQNKTWNQTDPQIPKSTWWLSDGPFSGFRIICTSDVSDPGKPAPATSGTPAERPGDAPAPTSIPPTKEPR
ncbi:MAG: formylglycine-generating enzyme family protein [Phycisphaerales bacterium]